MFFVFYVIALISSILMIISVNPINAVLFLITVFISVAMIFLMWNVEFLALIFIIIYVGAIAVLFLFIVMMINIKRIEKDNNTYLTIGIILIGFFSFQLLILVLYPTFEMNYGYLFNIDYFFYEKLNNLDEMNRINVVRDLGIILFKIRPFLVILVGLILLIAMIGAIYLTNLKRGFSMKKQLNQLSKISDNINHVHFFSN
jgi:NADH-quinone oxidoreductase subunit J